ERPGETVVEDVARDDLRERDDRHRGEEEGDQPLLQGLEPGEPHAASLSAAGCRATCSTSARRRSGPCRCPARTSSRREPSPSATRRGPTSTAAGPLPC